MVRINKHLLRFMGLGLFLGVSALIVVSKYLPLFLKHSIFICQQYLQSFSIKLSDKTGIVLSSVLLLVAFFAFKRLITIFIEVRRIKAELMLHSKSEPTIQRLLKRLELQSYVSIVKSETPFAFCYGIRHPKIYLSTGLVSLMNKKELEAILLHEKYHLKNRDSFIMLLASFIKLLFPFFPVISDLLTHYEINREVEADRETVQRLGDSTVLLSVLRKFLSLPQSSFATASAIADYKTLAPRINALLKHKKKTKTFKISNILVSFFFLLVFGGLILTPVHAVEMKMPQQDTTMLCLQNGACAAWCKAHNTVTPLRNTPFPASSLDNASHMYSSQN